MPIVVIGNKFPASKLDHMLNEADDLAAWLEELRRDIAMGRSEDTLPLHWDIKICKETLTDQVNEILIEVSGGL